MAETMPPASDIGREARPKQFTEAELFMRLHTYYQRIKVNNAVIPHVPLGIAGASAGWFDAKLEGGERTIRFIDALVIFKDKRWAVEIKVSKSDLKREVDHPEKSALWRAHTHSFYFLVPRDLLDHTLEVLPKPYGVMVPRSGSLIEIKRRSVVNRNCLDIPPDTWRRIARAYGVHAFEKRQRDAAGVA